MVEIKSAFAGFLMGGAKMGRWGKPFQRGRSFAFRLAIWHKSKKFFAGRQPPTMNDSIAGLLLEKSQEAFILAIEIYNKPTLKYRLEGFSFLMCNAWELMLKAHLAKTKGDSSIYYADKPSRTISLENCIHKIFTNEKSPMRVNLEKILELRNTSTHFITEEYEMVYVPLLQANVFNFVEKMNEFHGIDLTRIIPENFISLSVRITSLDDNAIRGKYPRQIAEKLLAARKSIGELSANSSSSLAIRVEHFYYSTKKKDEATELYHIDSHASEGVRIIKEIKNPDQTHKYTYKNCIDMIKRRLEKEGLKLLMNGEPVVFNKYHLKLFINYFNIKENEKLCFKHTVPSESYSYSLQAIEFIIEEIRKDPGNILDNIKKSIKKANPGSKGF